MKGARLAAQAVSVALVAGLLALLVWKVAHQVGTNTIASEVQKGKHPQAPAFSLPTLDGGSLASSSLKGKPQVLNFWASWCVPCRDESKLFVEAAQRYAGRVAVVGVDHQDFRGDARAFARKYGLTYRTVIDRGDKLYSKYGLTGVPETFCATSSGAVVAHVPGAVTADTLEQCIQDALSS